LEEKMMMKKKKLVYVKLEHPSGRTTIKGIRVKSRTLRGIQREYLGTAEHERTEAYPIAITKKPIKKRKTRTGYSIFGRGYRF